MLIPSLSALLAPVFATVFASWLMARTLPLPPRFVQSLQRLTFDLLMPVLLFHTMATVPIGDQLDAALLLAYYAPTLALFAAMLVLGRWRGRSLREANVLALAGTYGNAVLLGIPLVLRIFGESAAVPLFAIVGLHSALMFFLTTLVHELADDSLRLHTLLLNTGERLVRNPILIGLLGGTLVQLTGIAMPAPLLGFGTVVSVTAPWFALVAMGIGLAAHDLRGALADSALVLLCKHLVHPLLVFMAAAATLGLAHPATPVLVTIAALPSGINVYLFAVRFGAAKAASATAIVAGTALSCIGILAVLVLLGVPGRT